MRIIRYHKNSMKDQTFVVTICMAVLSIGGYSHIEIADIMADPIRDFSAGKVIKLPSLENINRMV